MTDELRDRLEAFVCGRISLGALRDWLVPRLRPEDHIAWDVYCKIEMALQHMQDWDESEEVVRGQLSSYLIERQTHSSNVTLRTRWALEG